MWVKVTYISEMKGCFTVVVSLSLALSGMLAFGAANIPYTDGFEGYSVGALPASPTGTWSTNGVGTVTVTAGDKASGNQSCAVTNDHLVLNVDQAAGVFTNVWIRYWTKPSFFDDANGQPMVPANELAAFYVGTNQIVMAYKYDTTNKWVSTGFWVPSNTWLGVLARIQYGSGAGAVTNWSLQMATNGYGSAFQSVFSGYACATGSVANSELKTVSFSNSVLVDAVYVYEDAGTGRGVSLPFADGFEAYTNAVALASHNTKWEVSGANASAVIKNTTKAEGSLSCLISNATLTLPVDQTKGAYSNVWCQSFSKPVPFDDSNGGPSPSNSAALWYISTSGVLRAYVNLGATSTNGWTNVVSGLTTGAWVGCAAHLDYATHNWDIYYTSGSYGTALAKVNGAPMIMQSGGATSSEIAEYIVENDAYVDAVALSVGNVAVTNAVSSAPNLAALSLAGGTTNIWSIPAHHYGSSDDTLSGLLGLDMMAGLQEGDQLRMWSTNVGGWNRYTLQDGVWIKSVLDPDTMAPSSLHVKSGTGMWVDRNNPTNTVVFVPYTATLYATNTLYGTNQPVTRGWNLLGWPYTSAQTASSQDWGFTGIAGVGDKIYVYNNGTYVRLWWDNSGKQWMAGSQPSTYSLQPRQGFWYYRNSTGTSTWTPTP